MHQLPQMRRSDRCLDAADTGHNIGSSRQPQCTDRALHKSWLRRMTLIGLHSGIFMNNFRRLHVSGIRSCMTYILKRSLQLNAGRALHDDAVTASPSHCSLGSRQDSCHSFNSGCSTAQSMLMQLLQQCSSRSAGTAVVPFWDIDVVCSAIWKLPARQAAAAAESATHWSCSLMLHTSWFIMH